MSTLGPVRDRTSPSILDYDVDPEDYFNNLKSKKEETSSEFLENLYTNTESLLKKAHALGQTKVVRKLLFT